MGDDIAVDPERLRAEAGRLDALGAEVASSLGNADKGIGGSGQAWTGVATSAFSTFTGYLASRRVSMQRHLGDMSAGLRTSANGFATRDGGTAATLTGSAPNPQQ